MNDPTLYPELSEAGALEAQALMDKFKQGLIKLADEALGHMYTEIVHDIGSDSWTNYRNDMVDGMKDYQNSKSSMRYEMKGIRAKILEDHREEVINDLNADLVEENEKLKERIKFLESMRSY